MRKRLELAGFLVFVALLALGQNQCPVPPAPFDATGEYEGTWWGTTDEAEPQEVVECPLGMSLTQNTSLQYPADHAVSGTITIDYSCIELPEWAERPEASEVEVSGILGDEGNLVLASGGCGTGFCVVLALNGPAQDTDSDGFVDTYSGDWGLAFLLAGVEPLGVSGGFEVAVTAGE